jgi:hypothetical protein
MIPARIIALNMTEFVKFYPTKYDYFLLFIFEFNVVLDCSGPRTNYTVIVWIGDNNYKDALQLLHIDHDRMQSHFFAFAALVDQILFDQNQTTHISIVYFDTNHAIEM